MAEQSPNAAAAGPVIAVLHGWLTDPDPGANQHPERRQAAADALAEIGDHGARALLEQALANLGQDRPSALAALLALAPGNEATLHQRLPDGLGGLLRLLHGTLPGALPAQRGRILALLEALGHPLCVVPAGTFRMGNDASGASSERPAHEVMLGEYWIDRYPVTNRQFAAFVAETGFTDTHWRAMAAGDREDHPVVFVSWHYASAYGAWCGKRLPTEAEWEKAARGTDGRRYPWGNQWDAERCNTSGRGTTPVGSDPRGVSPYGCHDLAGNVSEWTADWYDAGFYRRCPAENPMGPGTGTLRVVRGGAWFHPPVQARAASRLFAKPFGGIGYLGFRLLCGAPIR